MFNYNKLVVPGVVLYNRLYSQAVFILGRHVAAEKFDPEILNPPENLPGNFSNSWI